MAKTAKKKQQPGVSAVRGLAVKKSKRMPAAAVALPAGKKLALAKKPKPKALRMSSASEMAASPDRLTNLLAALHAVGAGTKISPRTKKLLSSGVAKMAQKLVEEAAETAIDAVRGVRVGVINESADLLYNLVVLWSAVGLTPDDIWAEMDRREATLGLAEKLPKPIDGSDM